MNIVLIPCWNRPDFLSLCLECIQHATGSDRYLYVFAVDRGFDPLVLSVIRSFPLPKVTLRVPNHPYHGGTANIMEGFKRVMGIADRVGATRVHVIEDDVWIAKDYFTWHELAEREFNPVVASACRNQNTRKPMTDKPDEVYYHRSYQSLGVSIRVDLLPKIVRHAHDRYYDDPVSYCIERFEYSSIPASHSEQAGLIRRIVESNNYDCLYAGSPRAYHAGFVGKNRPGEGIRGSLAERIEQLRSMSDEEMNARALDYKDIQRCEMEGYEIEGLALVGKQEVLFENALRNAVEATNDTLDVVDLYRQSLA